jgi:hypothetical protein
MQTAPTKDGKWVTLEVGTPVFRNGKLVGFYKYVLTSETYLVPSGGIAYYATRVYKPQQEQVTWQQSSPR